MTPSGRSRPEARGCLNSRLRLIYLEAGEESIQAMETNPHETGKKRQKQLISRKKNKQTKTPYYSELHVQTQNLVFSFLERNHTNYLITEG